MENFVKKKIILINYDLKEKKQKISQVNHSHFFNSFLGSSYVNKKELLLESYGFISLNKNHISEISDIINLQLNLKIDKLYDYISFYSGRKSILIEKRSDLSKKIDYFNNLKYQQIIMSNGNIYYVICD